VTTAEERTDIGPVLNFEYTEAKSTGTWMTTYDELRAKFPFELQIALQEWHKRIPHYRVADGADLSENGGQLGLNSLPLVWDVD
jgi:hypothetical protein